VSILIDINSKHLLVYMDSLIRTSSLPKQADSNALITTGIIIAGIIKKGGVKKNPEINTGYLLQR